jgi:hypothetical protein
MTVPWLGDIQLAPMEDRQPNFIREGGATALLIATKKQPQAVIQQPRGKSSDLSVREVQLALRQASEPT